QPQDLATPGGDVPIVDDNAHCVSRRRTAVASPVLGTRSTGNVLPLEIGRAGAAAGKYWLGGLDNVRIWNFARSAADIQANYLHELSGPPPPVLAANWQFNGDGSDSAGRDTAVLFGGATFSTDVPPPAKARNAEPDAVVHSDTDTHTHPDADTDCVA